MAGLECVKALKERLGGRDPTPQELAEVTGLDVPFCEALLHGEQAEEPEEPAPAPKAKAKVERRKKVKVNPPEAEPAEAEAVDPPKKKLRRADDPKFHMPPVQDDRQREPHEMDPPQDLDPEVPTVDLEVEGDTQVDEATPEDSQKRGQQQLQFQAWVISFWSFWYLIFGCFWLVLWFWFDILWKGQQGFADSAFDATWKVGG